MMERDAQSSIFYSIGSRDHEGSSFLFVGAKYQFFIHTTRAYRNEFFEVKETPEDVYLEVYKKRITPRHTEYGA